MTGTTSRALRERSTESSRLLWADTGPHAVDYRPDIDGLRAIAILPVILYHTGLGLLPGGYVGVDVFFVISGFLITGIVARQVDAGKFSLLTFYERRTRRILPALLAVIATVLAVAAYLYLPIDLERLAKSALATLTFCSNIYFYFSAGYFADTSTVKPLLHTWSLAVEEQFYLFFPLLLLLIQRYAARWRAAILAAAGAISFVAGVILTRANPDFAFYMLPTRAWELTIGALLALGAVPPVRHSGLRELLAALGLVAILLACLLFKEGTDFPGAAALLPVGGAALLIHLAPGTRIGRLISLGPVVFVGLISYSLYLWHWPIIVFLGYRQGIELSLGQAAIAIALSFVAAILSWRYVERPFRSAVRISREQLFLCVASASLALAAVGAAAIADKGWPSRFAPEVVRLDQFSESFSPARDACHRFNLSNAPYCMLGGKSAPVAAVWSDSHGVEMAYAIGEILGRTGQSVRQYSFSGCPPILDLAKAERGCAEHNRRAFREIMADKGLTTVILTAHWAKKRHARTPHFAADLERTIALLRRGGKQVIFVGAVAPSEYDVPRHLALLANAGRLEEAAGMTRAKLDRVTDYLAPTIGRLQVEGVTVIQPEDIFCPGQQCLLSLDRQLLYFDSHHISMPAARMLSGIIVARMPLPPGTEPAQAHPAAKQGARAADPGDRRSRQFH